MTSRSKAFIVRVGVAIRDSELGDPIELKELRLTVRGEPSEVASQIEAVALETARSIVQSFLANHAGKDSAA